MRKILFFYASYCGKCKAIERRLKRLEHESLLKITYEMYNIDIDRKIFIKYKVDGVPTLVLLEADREVRRFVGSAYREDLIEFIR